MLLLIVLLNFLSFPQASIFTKRDGLRLIALTYPFIFGFLQSLTNFQLPWSLSNHVFIDLSSRFYFLDYFLFNLFNIKDINI